jgi:predicted  nucleic acid-binding Zn-ribbon protein
MSVTITNDTVRLQNLKSTIDRGKTEKARAEATLEELKKQETSLKDQSRTLGVEPENIDSEITRLQNDIEHGLSEAERLLNPATAPAAAPGQG